MEREVQGRKREIRPFGDRVPPNPEVAKAHHRFHAHSIENDNLVSDFDPALSQELKDVLGAEKFEGAK